MGEVATRHDNLRIPITAKDRIPGDTPYYGANGIQDYVEGYTHEGEFVLVAEDGATDLDNYPVRLISGLSWVNNHAHVIKAIPDVAQNRFIMYLIKSMDIASYLVGGTRSKLNAEVLMGIELKLPSNSEQIYIGALLSTLDSLITLHQRKCQYRSLYGYLSWEQRKLGELYSLVSEKNDLTFGRESIISVANMYFNANVNVTDEQYLRTYNVMRLGDIAFEGHSNKEFSHGRFVENYIGDGIVSHIFTVLRPRVPFDVNYWRYAINNEKLMRLSLIRSTKASTMMHDLVPSDFLREAIPTPTLAEQKEIGAFLVGLDHLITLHQ